MLTAFTGYWRTVACHYPFCRECLVGATLCIGPVSIANEIGRSLLSFEGRCSQECGGRLRWVNCHSLSFHWFNRLGWSLLWRGMAAKWPAWKKKRKIHRNMKHSCRCNHWPLRWITCRRCCCCCCCCDRFNAPVVILAGVHSSQITLNVLFCCRPFEMIAYLSLCLLLAASPPLFQAKSISNHGNHFSDSPRAGPITLGGWVRGISGTRDGWGAVSTYMKGGRGSQKAALNPPPKGPVVKALDRFSVVALWGGKQTNLPLRAVASLRSIRRCQCPMERDAWNGAGPNDLLIRCGCKVDGKSFVSATWFWWTGRPRTRFLFCLTHRPIPLFRKWTKFKLTKW